MKCVLSDHLAPPGGRRAPTTSRRRSSFSGASGSLSTSPPPSPRCLPPRAARGRDFPSFVPCDMSRHCSDASGWLIRAWFTELSCAAGPQGHVHRLKASKNKALVWSVFCLALPCAVLLFAGETEFNCAFKVSRAPPPLQVAQNAWGWVRIAQFSEREQRAFAGSSQPAHVRQVNCDRETFFRIADHWVNNFLFPYERIGGRRIRPRPALAVQPQRRLTERAVPAGRHCLGRTARLDQLPASLQGSRRRRPSPRHPHPPGPAPAPVSATASARARTRRSAAALSPRRRCDRCRRDETCPVSTGEGTRRARLVRGKGRDVSG